MRLPHIYRFYLPLTLRLAPCRPRHGPRACPRAVRKEERDRKERTGEKGDKRKCETGREICHDDPIMGQLRAVAGRASTSSFRFASSFANITTWDFEDSLIRLDCVDSALFLFSEEIRHSLASVN